MNETRTVLLKTGFLSVDIFPGAAFAFDDLCAFAARNNRKRGFLFISKVLGKHWPVAPTVMRNIHAHLAADIPAGAAPTVFIGMAETATGLGHGVFEAFLQRNPDHPALYLHSTRYRVASREFLGFEERHTHAPELFLYRPLDGNHDDLFRTAGTLVLIDDEISTGSTLCNLARAYLSVNPQLQQIVFASITDFSGSDAGQRFSAEIGIPVRRVAALRGAFQFQPVEHWPGEPPLPAVGDNDCEEGFMADRLGRFGISAAIHIPPENIDTLVAGLDANARVLVLGTGELMHPAFRLGLELEAKGFAVAVQATTRSPILVGEGISKCMGFADNYGENIQNYLYNVGQGEYDLCIICHETPLGDELMEIAQQLGRCLFYDCRNL
jgi:hypothetical protein